MAVENKEFLCLVGAFGALLDFQKMSNNYFSQRSWSRYSFDMYFDNTCTSIAEAAR